MTTDHASKVWGFANIGTSFAGGQLATRLRRRSPVIYDGMSPTPIRHYVVGPWPVAADSFGIAFPSGLLMVASSAGLYGTGTINEQCENYWSNYYTVGASVYPVPQALPSGYTRNPQANFYGFTSATYPGPPWLRVTASGLATPTGWTPPGGTWNDTFTTGMSQSNPATSGNFTFRLNGTFSPIDQDVGYRNCQLIFLVGLPSTGSGGVSGGSLSYTISHNADGSVGSSTGDLDTIDFTGTVSAGQYVHGAFSSPNWFWTTDPVNIGALTSPLGIPCRFAIRVTSNTLVYTPAGGGGGTLPVTYGNFGATCQASSRCDIPFQCDIVGAGDLIAPGGYVP